MSKAKKTLVFLLVFVIFCSFGLTSASAEEFKYTSVAVNIEKAQAKYYGGTTSSWIEYTPVKLRSPFGGIFYGVQHNSIYVSGDTNAINCNYYFTPYKIKKNHKYIIKLNVAIPSYSLAFGNYVNGEISDSAMAGIYPSVLNICNTSRAVVVKSNTNSEYNDYNAEQRYYWNYNHRLVQHNSDSASFGFLDFTVEFVAPENDTLSFISVYYQAAKNGVPFTGYIGLSDFEISESTNTVDSFKDALNEYTEEEIEKIESETNKTVDDVEEVLGDITEDAETIEQDFDTIVDVMITDTLDASWTIPSIEFPSVGDSIEGFTLLDEQKIDFGFWISKIPPNILQIVRILCTISLIVFCFKELISLIRSVMVKGD